MLFVLLAHSLFAQLSGTGCLGETNYTDGQPNDPIYYYQIGELGELTVVPEVAGSSFNFVWYRYTPGSLSWAAYTTQNNQATSTISNLQPGAYFVSVRNASNVIVGCYRAWIAGVLQEPQVDVQPIPSNCVGPVTLTGTFSPGQISTISNLPESQLFINANTEISVCFTGVHEWVSDLAFYLRGPSACGSPTVLLMANPGALGQGNCNMGMNFTNLCFSTESNVNLNVCNAATPLTGTYGRYGPGAGTPINWTSLNGCDAMNGGWAVQVYDCAGLDVGALTDATITFTGFDLCGAQQTATYSTPNNYYSAITDNSCSAASASIYSVAPAAAPANLNCSFGYEWTSDPPVNIPNATTSLNINLNALTDASGNPIPWQDVDFTLSAICNCDLIAHENDCFGNLWTDTETYDNLLNYLTVDDLAPLCNNDGVVQLTANIPGGTWSGTGITDAALGTFDPLISGGGDFDVEYSFGDPCYQPDQTTITVIPDPTISITTPAVACPGSTVTVNATASAGTVEWMDANGNIIDTGTSTDVAYSVSTPLEAVLTDVCLNTANANVTVPYEAIPTIELGNTVTLCEGLSTQLAAVITGNYATIEWTTADGLINGPIDTPTIETETEGTYTATVITALGCDYSDDVLVESSPLPVLVTSGDDDVCAGDLYNLSVSGAETYQWSPADYLSADDISNPAVDLAQTTTYTVQGFTADGCVSDATLTLTFIDYPTVSVVAPAMVCPETVVTLNATGTIGTWEWTLDDGTVIGAGDQIDVQWSTTTNVNVEVTDACLNTATANVEVLYEEIPTLVTDNTVSLCAGLTAQLEVVITGNYNTIEWTTADGLIDGPFDTPFIDTETEGTYTATVTTAVGCDYSEDVLVESSPLPVLVVSANDDVCAGDLYNLSVSGAQSYQWSPADYLSADDISNPVVDLEQTTTYTVQGFSADGCVSDATVTLTYIDYPTVSVVAPAMACPESVVTLNATGTAGTWEWTLDDGTALGAGDQIDVQWSTTTNVNVEVTDACLNTATANVEVLYEEIPTLVTDNTVSLCAGLTAQLEVVITGNYNTIEWTTADGLIDGPFDTPLIDTETEGTYTATVITALGCDYSEDVLVVSSPLPVLVTSGDDDVCAGDLYNLSVSGAETYQWSPADYLSADDISNPVVDLEQTTTYTVQGFTADGCVSDATVTLTYIDYPTVSVVAPAMVCPESVVTLNATGTAGTWEWTLDDGTALGAGDQIDVQWSTTTNVNVEVTDACLNTATAAVEVQYEAIPEVDAGDDEILCAGSEVILEAIVAGAYVSLNWSTIDGTISGATNTPVIETDDEGTYTVTVTTALNCIHSDDVFVDVVPLPLVDAGANDIICASQPYALNATGAVTYSWWPVTGLSNAMIASPQTTLSTPITYTVTGTDANGCVNTDQIQLTLFPQPQLFANSVSMICPQENVALNVNGTTGTVSWTPSTALNTTIGSSVIASPGITTLYTATLTDACGAEAQAQITVPVEPLYTVSAGQDVAFCEGGSIQLQGNVDGINPIIEWLGPDGVILSDNSVSPIADIPGIFTLHVETPLGCTYQDDVQVIENQFPVFNVQDTYYYCPGDSVEAIILGNWDSVQWSDGTTGSSSYFSSEGIIEVTVTENNCSTTDDFTVLEVVLPQIDLGPAIEICADETATIDAGFTGEWNTGANSSSITVSEQGMYSFEYTQQGCVVTDEVALVVKPLPFARAISKQFGCMESDYTIVIDDYSEGSYLWNDGSTDTYLVVDQPGNYWFMVTNDCGSSVQPVDVVFEDCNVGVYIPNSFTPDNDGVNDVWKIEARNIKSLKTQVMNRWGQLVFESTDMSPVWTGGFQSGDTYVPDGLYFFRIELEKLDGQNELREGSMLIIR